jgi:hypothetical protein
MVNNNAAAIAPTLTLTPLHCGLGDILQDEPEQNGDPCDGYHKVKNGERKRRDWYKATENFVTASRAAALARREVKSMKPMLMTIQNGKMRSRNSCQIPEPAFSFTSQIRSRADRSSHKNPEAPETRVSRPMKEEIIPVLARLPASNSDWRAVAPSNPTGDRAWESK